MNEPDNFALVPRPLGALEKTEPGAKRILVGMVADTLTLVKKARPFRIIHHDDEEWFLEMIGAIITQKFKNVVLDTFQNGDEAWEELLRADPDLLITDLRNDNVPLRPGSFVRPNYGMNGYELLSLLAQKNVKYPILVLSGSIGMEGNESKERQYARPKLNTSFLLKPCTLEELYVELAKHLVTSDKP